MADAGMKAKRFSLLRVAALLGIGLAIFIAFVGCSAQRMVFQPTRIMNAHPGDIHRQYEDVYFDTADKLRLNGWFYACQTNGQRSPFVVLVCHGNAGNLSHRLQLIQTLLEAGADVFAFDYRGYGKSEGSPSEKGTYLDALTAWDWLHAKGYSGSNIVALGESLGGGVACELACTKPLAGLILQSTFTSVPDVASEFVSSLPVGWLLTSRYNNREKLPRIHIPVLIMHSRGDRIIAFHHAERNFSVANAPKTLCELRGDHNDAVFLGAAEYREGVRQFLSQVSKARAD